MAPLNFATPPPQVANVLVSFPRRHVLLVTLNRPAQLNAIPTTQHYQLDALFSWYDAEPSLRCAVITGAGRAFCAGADLKEWHERNRGSTTLVVGASKPGTGTGTEKEDERRKWPDSGFGGLSNRRGKKPIIAAVNGLCLGGGMEIVINTDLVIASEAAKFGLPEVTRGVVAIAGALPRLIRSVGRQRAGEMALTGRMFTAREILGWGLVNRVVAAGDLLDESIKTAETIAGNSPDAVVVSREGLMVGWDAVEPQRGTFQLDKGLYAQMEGGDNMKEGVMSFVEKRKAVWKDSKL
jgi:enoyl-CoA hydratase/carnithine racemase